MLPKFIRKKFRGVQVPLGNWIVRHVLELIILSPAILITWLYLKIHKYEVIIVGVGSSAISSFLTPLEPELRKRINAPFGLSRTVVLCMSVDANSQIRKMYNEIVKIYGDEKKLMRRLVWWASRFKVKVTTPAQFMSDKYWRIGFPSVSLNPADNEIGNSYLRSVGISGNKFICYATRTESYYTKLIEQGVVVKPRSVRNPDEKIYLSVANKLAKDDLAVIRMGKDLNSSISSIKYPMVVDYATKDHSDLLDCFLLKNAKYLINGVTGIFWFRWLFNLPTVHCDVYHIAGVDMLNDLFIFQTVWMINERRLATVSEMLKMRSEYSDERHQARLGVELIKNTANEIYAVCDEMNSRIDGTWITTPEDEELQRRYKELSIKYSVNSPLNGGGRVGTQFLRDNQNLLR